MPLVPWRSCASLTAGPWTRLPGSQRLFSALARLLPRVAAARSPGLGARSPGLGAWSLEPGARGSEPGARRPGLGAWSPEPGARSSSAPPPHPLLGCFPYLLAARWAPGGSTGARRSPGDPYQGGSGTRSVPCSDLSRLQRGQGPGRTGSAGIPDFITTWGNLPGPDPEPSLPLDRASTRHAGVPKSAIEPEATDRFKKK